MLRFCHLSCLFAILAASAAGKSKAPHLVEDINRSPGGVTPRIVWAETVGQHVVFSRYSTTMGNEMWVAGESGEARLLKNLFPGAKGALDSTWAPPVADGKVIYFQADDGKHGLELWRSDGTAKDTRMVVDLEPGAEGGNPAPIHAAEGRIFFYTYPVDGSAPTLWCTRGKPGSTEALNPAGSNGLRPFDRFGPFATLGKDTFFTSANQLWKSDGTAAGTTLVESLPLDTGFWPQAMQAVNGSLYITFNDSFHAQLWISQGTPGSSHRLAGVDGFASFRDRPFTAIGKQVFFAFGEDSDASLWVTDGTQQGTRKLALLEAEAELPYRPSGLHLTAYQGAVYFEAINDDSRRKIWRSDGTPQGTFPIEDLGTAPVFGLEGDLEVAGKWLYYTTSEPSLDYSLWRTDGRAGSAMRLKLLSEGGSGVEHPVMKAAGDSLFFGSGWGTLEEGLWRTAGSAGSTMRVTSLEKSSKDAFTYDYIFPAPAPFMPVGDGGVVFAPEDGAPGVELWFSDGGKKRTRPIHSWSDPAASLSSVGNCAGKALFTLNSGGVAALWITDGSAAGTRPLDASFTYLPFSTVSVGEVAYFLAYEGSSYHLWKTDGSAQGTVDLMNVPAFLQHGLLASPLVLVDGYLYFTTDSGARQFTLWRTAANGQGSLERIKELDTGENGYAGLMPLAVGGRLDFFVRYGPGEWQLWTSDGTADGTIFLASTPGQIVSSQALGDRHVFLSEDRGKKEWYRSDGTAAGTVAYADAVDTIENVSGTTVAGAWIYYFAEDSKDSYLWKTNGTSAGTVKVGRVGGSYNVPAGATLAAGNSFYFSGVDATHGRELWRSDGTLAGTRMVRDLKPGVADSAPADFVRSGSRLFFHAEAKGVGRELHAMDLPE